MQATAETTELRQYLTFHVSGGAYAVGILRVREILEYRPVTRVPMAPDWIHGVLNLRGSVVPVVDLAVRFALPRAVVGRRTCIVIVEARIEETDTLLGLVAESVNEVIDLAADAVTAPPSFGAAVPVEYLEGLARIGDDFVLVLDVDRVLSLRELAPAAPEIVAPGIDDPS